MLTKPYCTLADVQAECGNSTAEAVPAIENAINLASRYIESECGRDFLFHDHKTTPYLVPHTAVGGSYIVIPWPCLTPNAVSVTIDGEAVDASEFHVINDAQCFASYLVRSGKPWVADEEPRVSIRVGNGIPRLAVIEVRAEFGFRPASEQPDATPSPELPGTLRWAATVVAAVRSGKLKKESIGLDGSRMSMVARNIPREVQETLKRLRIRSSF